MTKMSGSSVVVTLLAVSFLLTLTLGVVRVLPTHGREIEKQTEKQAAKQSAWAGIEHGLLLLRMSRVSEALDIHSLIFSPREKRENCAIYVEKCLTLNRLLGDSSQGKLITVRLDRRTSYQLALGHVTTVVGNPADMFDDWGMLQGLSLTHWGNRNPVFRHDDTVRFKVTHPGEDITFFAALMPHEACQKVGKGTATARWVDKTGKMVSETNINISPGDTFQKTTIVFPKLQVQPNVLSFTFYVAPSEPSCFGRFALQSTREGSLDFGFDVIESKGTYKRTTHTTRLLVGREQGQILGVYEGFELN